MRPRSDMAQMSNPCLCTFASIDEDYDTTRIDTCRHRRLPRPALALVARSVLDQEGMLVPLVSGLVPSFGL
jgi:hypothetical protein